MLWPGEVLGQRCQFSWQQTGTWQVPWSQHQCQASFGAACNEGQWWIDDGSTVHLQVAYEHGHAKGTRTLTCLFLWPLWAIHHGYKFGTRHPQSFLWPHKRCNQWGMKTGPCPLNWTMRLSMPKQSRITLLTLKYSSLLEICMNEPMGSLPLIWLKR